MPILPPQSIRTMHNTTAGKENDLEDSDCLSHFCFPLPHLNRYLPRKMSQLKLKK